MAKDVISDNRHGMVQMTVSEAGRDGCAPEGTLEVLEGVA